MKISLNLSSESATKKQMANAEILFGKSAKKVLPTLEMYSKEKIVDTAGLDALLAFLKSASPEQVEKFANTKASANVKSAVKKLAVAKQFPTIIAALKLIKPLKSYQVQATPKVVKGYSEDEHGEMYNGTYLYDRAYLPNGKPGVEPLPIEKLPKLTQALLDSGWHFGEAGLLVKNSISRSRYQISISSYPEKADESNADYSLPRSDGYAIEISIFDSVKNDSDLITIRPSGNESQDLRTIESKVKDFLSSNRKNPNELKKTTVELAKLLVQGKNGLEAGRVTKFNKHSMSVPISGLGYLSKDLDWKTIERIKDVEPANYSHSELMTIGKKMLGRSFRPSDLKTTRAVTGTPVYETSDDETLMFLKYKNTVALLVLRTDLYGTDEDSYLYCAYE